MSTDNSQQQSIDLSRIVSSSLCPAPFLRSMEKEDIKQFFYDYSRYEAGCTSVSGIIVEPSPLRLLIDDTVKEIITFTTGKSDNSWWIKAANDDVKVSITSHIRAHDEADANRVLSKTRMHHNKITLHDLVDYIRNFRMEYNLLTQFGKSNVTLSNKMVIDSFIDGIEPKSMKSRVKAFNSDSIESSFKHSIEKFKEYEDAAKLCNANLEPPSKRQKLDDEGNRIPNKTNLFCTFCRKKGHNASKCWFKTSTSDASSSVDAGHISKPESSRVDASSSIAGKNYDRRSIRFTNNKHPDSRRSIEETRKVPTGVLKKVNNLLSNVELSQEDRKSLGNFCEFPKRS